MTNKTKIAVAAALIAAFATPALAQGQGYGYHAHTQRLIEGRNSGVIVDPGFTSTDTSRESLVRAN
jgi:hypothetical protein